MKKKILSLLLTIAITLSLCACHGSFGSVNLSEPVEIPEDGIIQESLIGQMKSENSIGVFTGKSGSYKYEWTIFGSDISAPKEINLSAQIRKSDEGDIAVTLNQKEAFGFSALLSIYLDAQWGAQSATAYADADAFASVSVTGSKTTILNVNLDGTVGQFVISPDALPETETTSATQPEETTSPPQQTETNQSAQPTEATISVQPEEMIIPTETNAPDQPVTEPEETTESTESAGKDKYLTDPVPAGKPTPVEPEDAEVDKGKSYTCTFSIECSTILNNLEQLDPDKLEMVPSGGVILSTTTVTFYEGESVFDVLQRLCKEKGIHMEAEWTPIYNSAYVEGIHNLYEFDCGALSGWMYKVNGWYPNYGCSRYQLKDGDLVEWRYTCDLGNDVGGGYAVGN